MTSTATKSCIGLVALDAGLLALALVVGFPDSARVCDGLGHPYSQWKKSKEATLGLYLYTIAYIALGTFYGLTLVDKRHLGMGESSLSSSSLP
jgi:hypothetical protein